MSNRNLSITLPEPCSEDWAKMSPEAKGRFCDKCCKVVMDFTAMPTADVVKFISDRSSEKICGRFRSDQVSQPPQFPKENVSVAGKMKVFLAALVFVFGGFLFTGCNVTGNPQGEPVAVDSAQLKKDSLKTTQQDSVPKADTAKPEIQGQALMKDSIGRKNQMMLGGPVMQECHPVQDENNQKTMGAPVIVPEPPKEVMMGKPSIPKK